jgi:Mor family transcriptional regulator
MQLTEIPEKFFVEYKLYDNEDLFDYINELIEDFDTLDDLPDDFTEKLYKAELKPVYKFDVYELLNLIPEENLPSVDLTDNEKEEKLIKDIIEKHLISLNEELPEYWYETKDYYLLTKQELIEIYNDNK